MFIDTIKTVLYSNDTIPILTIFIVTMVTLRFFYLKSKRERIVFYKEFLMILGVVYMFLLFSLLTNGDIDQGSTYNIIPFKEMFRYTFGSKLFYYQIVGNIVVFLIFGLIISEYIKPKKIYPILFTTIIVSITVELVQHYIGRCFDIDDILLNIIGGILGYILYICLQGINKRLPSFFHKEGLYNFICFIIVIVIAIYVLKIMGVVSIK